MPRVGRIFAVIMVLSTTCVADAQRSPARSWWERTPVVQSRHYEIKTDLPRPAAQAYARHLDRMYEEFARRLADLPPRGPEQLRVYMFNTSKDYIRTLRLGWGIDATGTGGMFFVNAQGSGLAFWVEGLPTGRVHHVIQHEGFHQFAYSRFGTDLPPWVNEGLAELFGEAVLVDDRLILGQSTPRVVERVRDAIELGESIPFLRMLMATGDQWAAMVKTGEADLFYHQAWSMVHFLVYGEDGRYRKSFEQYLRLLNHGLPPDAAWTREFGEDIAAFEQRWKLYAAQATPSAFVTALERIEFLAEGAKALAADGVVPESLDALRTTLIERGFKHVIGDHGASVTLRATDPAVFVIPTDERNPEAPIFVVSKAERRRMTRKEERLEAALPTPSSITTTGLRPKNLTLRWSRDPATGAFSYAVDVE